MTDYRIIFIHGYTASSKENWYPNLSAELDKFGVDYVVPDLPGGDKPHAQEWLETIHQVVSLSTKPVIFVGHSLGTRAVLLYLEKYRPKVEKVFLIAAFNNDLSNGQRHEGETYPDFFEHQIDMNIVRPLVKKFIVLHSTDDDSIPYSQAEDISSDLSAQLHAFSDRGHFDRPESYFFVLQVLRNELGF